MLPMVEAKPEEAKLVVKEEKPVEAKEQKLSDTVKVKVLIGTLQWENGVFSKGDTFTVSKERLKLFDQTDIQIIEG